MYNSWSRERALTGIQRSSNLNFMQEKRKIQQPLASEGTVEKVVKWRSVSESVCEYKRCNLALTVQGISLLQSFGTHTATVSVKWEDLHEERNSTPCLSLCSCMCHCQSMRVIIPKIVMIDVCDCSYTILGEHSVFLLLSDWDCFSFPMNCIVLHNLKN